MADVTFQGFLSIIKGSQSAKMDAGVLTASMAGADIADFSQDILTSETAIAFPASVASPGYCMIQNLDATHYVSLRAASGATDLIKIPAGATAGPFLFSTT